MPTLLNEKGFRFFFYNNENDEPIHVHVKKGDAKEIWLEPVLAIAWFHEFTNAEEKVIRQIAQNHTEFFKTKWNEYFNKK